MTGKVTTILIFLLSIIAVDSYAQKSAQATMRVSVRVVKGAGIKLSDQGNIRLSKTGSCQLGKLTFNNLSSQGTRISISQHITLTDANGSTVGVDVSAHSPNGKGLSKDIDLNASHPSNIKDGHYKGQLVATVEYF